ncbi:MAG: hypothetical protein NTV69_13100 [Caldilinea sp.]|nr:hypothetical protein [Caldilinea sp.]
MFCLWASTRTQGKWATTWAGVPSALALSTTMTSRRHPWGRTRSVGAVATLQRSIDARQRCSRGHTFQLTITIERSQGIELIGSLL